uniref:RNA helicase n=1 Tax=Lygus hesperus TaxID=30085 RepID=A0A0A9ZI32_LYGHE
MTHPVNDGPITILKVVTPGCYWIKCQSCCGSSRIPESIRRKPFSEDFYPPNGAKVLVHDEDGFFYHGTICGRGEFPIFASMQARKYVIQLTHTFQVKDFDRCNIYPTFDERSFACESAHLISLQRVLPEFPPAEFGSSRESNNAEACQSFEDKIRNWDKFNDVVEDLIQSRHGFRYEHLQVINGSLYGKISYFEKSRDMNMKDFLASKNIAARTSFRFETVIQSLMNRPLHNCSNPLPVYSPNVPLVFTVPPIVPVPPIIKKDLYDLNKFQVHKEDLKIHENLWTPFSSNILFTGICKFRKGCVPVRYVAPDGKIFLGTVLSPQVTYNETCEREKPPDYELKKFLKQLSFPCEPQRFAPFSYQMDRLYEMPPSTDESSVSSLSVKEGMFDYEFEEALSQFTQQGGLLEEYISLSSLPPTSQTLLDSAEKLFDDLDVLELNDWQKVSLPSMLSKKNVLVIGPQSQGKMTTSIVSTLLLMNEPSEKIRQNSISPVFVLLVDDYKRANEAARLCNRLSSDLKVIIMTYSQISEAQIQETQLGCDVLISTPSNWLKLCGDLDCFNYSNLAHVVFDSFEKLHKDYPSEMQTIFEDLKLKNHVQAIFLSNVWGTFLLDFVNSLGNTTRCVIDILQACFCYRVVPTIVIAPENWEELLSSIITKDVTTLRLLLCQDHNEVSAIKSRMDHLDGVLFVHENEETNSVTEKIKLWKSNESTFLISSDILFSKLDFAQNVNLLVSWKQKPCSRPTLIRRFMSIRGHANRERRKVPVYIFCSRDNLEELVFIKSVMENVKKPVFLGGNLDECIESSFKDRENLKLGNHCTSFCMFGKCDLTPLCPYRHGFRHEDLIHSCKNRVFLKISLLKLHSAFHFTVRIEDVISNHESDDAILHSLKSKLSKIEMGLERAFESNEMRSFNFIENLKVGDVVGALISGDENIFRRVKILSMFDNDDHEGFTCDVSMMDFDEPCLILSVKHLFPLSSEIASHPRDTVDIFLSNLVPVDFKSSWVFETKSFLTNYVELVATQANDCLSNFLAGPVDVVIDRSVVVDSMHWCRIDGTDEKAKYLSERSMKDVVLASNYVKETQNTSYYYLN